ncbi:MAG: nitrate reductase molybdenum cofactor assembly chaperone [Pirellulales bacterium]|nr:nitrate reductase molybdenum cofactor assembly chaperone [Pirellulales bacterium]
MTNELPILEAFYDEPRPSEIARALGTISRLLAYPDQHYLQLVELLYVIVQSEYPEAVGGIGEFGGYVERCAAFQLEEDYAKTFDVNPACALEVGWHLFGEDYTRGQFLVRMRQELAKYEIPESAELPDHLTHVLALIAALPEEEARRFTHACVFPALHKMRGSLDKNESPFRHVVHCLLMVLERQFGASEPWGENDERLLRNHDAFPGQNGPRPQGLSDPLRSYPMPGAAVASGGEFVPLQMQYNHGSNTSQEAQGTFPKETT